MFSPEGHAALAASFQKFAAQPQQAGLVQQALREELHANLRGQELERIAALRQKAEEEGPEVMAACEPYLRHACLVRILCSFTNSSVASLRSWVCNPEVQALLGHAKQMLVEGRCSDRELQHLMVSQLQDNKNPHHQEFADATSLSAALPTEQLVQALNEHLEERRAGHTALRAGDAAGALAAYNRALAVVRVVRGRSGADQEEVVACKAAVLLDAAAAHMALHAYGAALTCCDEALALSPSGAAYLQRARAHMMRRERAAAGKDVAQAVALDEGMREQGQALLQDMQDLAAQDRVKESQVYKRMLGGSHK